MVVEQPQQRAHLYQQQVQQLYVRDDHREDTPEEVDEILSQELLRLSVNDRNGIAEEIHGVGCLAPDETDELVETSLRALQEELSRLDPAMAPTRAFGQSQTLSHTYVNGRDFRLRFLRCELFDVKKAAVRICEFLEHARDLFGPQALRRPVRLDDFDKDELRAFKQGWYQLLPCRDRSGRKIMAIFPGSGTEELPPGTKAKIALYTSWAAGSNDVDTQRKGHAALVWFDHAFRGTQRPKRYAAEPNLRSVRISAIHCCTPDTPFFRIRRSVMFMRMGNDARHKLRVHLGEPVELRYKLQAFGIPAEKIPLTWSGKIKVNYLKQWMRLRETIENWENLPTVSQTKVPIECPNLNDVLFRQGPSVLGHPGNVAFREMVESRLRQLEPQPRLNDNEKSIKKKATGKKVKTRKLVNEIIRDIRQNRGGRILVWNDEGWWEESDEGEQIYSKVECIVRGYRLKLKRGELFTSTKTPITHHPERERERKRAQARAPREEEPPPQQQPQEPPQHLKLKSGTTLFLNNQADGLFGACCTDRNTRKRQRALVGTELSSNDESDTMECFGNVCE